MFICYGTMLKMLQFDHDRPVSCGRVFNIGTEIMSASATSAQAGWLKVLYRNHRTALLNKKYYGTRLAIMQSRNKWMEWLIAIGVTGSSISGWAVWDLEPWNYVWIVIAAISTILAVTKPIVNFAANIERYAKLFSNYSYSHTQLAHLVDQVTANHAITGEMLSTYDEVVRTMGQLSGLDDPKPDELLRRTCYQQVLTELPVSRYWMPSS